MDEGHIDHEILEIELIEDPLPGSSLGTIGRFVEGRWPRGADVCRSVGIEVPYSEEDLGWVDPATLRLFEIDVEERGYALLPSSGVDPERRVVYGSVSGGGVYGVVGLPADPAVMRTVRILYSLMGE